jgi:hypothetical protein
MCIRRAHLGMMAAATLLAGCSFLSDTADPVWSTLSEEDAVKNGTTTPDAPRLRPSAAEFANIIDRRPLVIIRFYRANVPYEEALHTAGSRALERRPDVVFDLVAVAPQPGNPSQITIHSKVSKRNAENVFRFLTDMGLPAERVSLSATTNAVVQSDEVRLYVR